MNSSVSKMFAVLDEERTMIPIISLGSNSNSQSTPGYYTYSSKQFKPSDYYTSYANSKQEIDYSTYLYSDSVTEQYNLKPSSSSNTNNNDLLNANDLLNKTAQLINKQRKIKQLKLQNEQKQLYLQQQQSNHDPKQFVQMQPTSYLSQLQQQIQMQVEELQNELKRKQQQQELLQKQIEQQMLREQQIKHQEMLQYQRKQLIQQQQQMANTNLPRSVSLEKSRSSQAESKLRSTSLATRNLEYNTPVNNKNSNERMSRSTLYRIEKSQKQIDLENENISGEYNKLLKNLIESKNRVQSVSPKRKDELDRTRAMSTPKINNYTNFEYLNGKQNIKNGMSVSSTNLNNPDPLRSLEAAVFGPKKPSTTSTVSINGIFNNNSYIYDKNVNQTYSGRPSGKYAENMGTRPPEETKKTGNMSFVYVSAQNRQGAYGNYGTRPNEIYSKENEQIIKSYNALIKEKLNKSQSNLLLQPAKSIVEYNNNNGLNGYNMSNQNISVQPSTSSNYIFIPNKQEKQIASKEPKSLEVNVSENDSVEFEVRDSQTLEKKLRKIQIKKLLVEEKKQLQNQFKELELHLQEQEIREKLYQEQELKKQQREKELADKLLKEKQRREQEMLEQQRREFELRERLRKEQEQKEQEMRERIRREQEQLREKQRKEQEEKEKLEKQRQKEEEMLKEKQRREEEEQKLREQEEHDLIEEVLRIKELEKIIKKQEAKSPSRDEILANNKNTIQINMDEFTRLEFADEKNEDLAAEIEIGRKNSLSLDENEIEIKDFNERLPKSYSNEFNFRPKFRGYFGELPDDLADEFTHEISPEPVKAQVEQENNGYDTIIQDIKSTVSNLLSSHKLSSLMANNVEVILEEEEEEAEREYKEMLAYSKSNILKKFFSNNSRTRIQDLNNSSSDESDYLSDSA